MVSIDAQNKLEELKRYCNVEYYDRVSSDIIYPNTEKFDTSLELLEFYLAGIKKVWNERVQYFQLKAIGNAIESLSEALMIAAIPYPETSELIDSNSDDFGRSFLRLERMISLLIESKELIRDSILSSDDNERKAEFLDCILRTIDAIFGMDTLIKPPDTESKAALQLEEIDLGDFGDDL
jgi:hypothetical protein